MLNRKQNKPQTKVEQAEIRHPLIKAYACICEYLGVSLSNKNLQFNDSEPVTIDKAAKRLGVRFRQVALAGKWWTGDGGPLLAFLDEAEDPVALLPVAPGHYRLYQPSQGATMEMDSSLADRLRPYAFALYRPFHSGSVDLRYLVAFGLRSFWKRDFWAVAMMGILGGILGLAIPYVTGILFDYVVPGHLYSQMAWLMMILLASSFASFTFQFTRSLALMRMEGKLDMSLESALWDRILKLPANFFRDYSAGDLAVRAEGISTIRKIVSGMAVNTLLSAIFSVFNLVLVFTYDVHAGCTVLVCAVILVSANVIYGRRLRKAEYEITLQSGKIRGLLFQLLRGIHKFIITGAEKVAFELWDRQFTEMKKLDLRVGFMSYHMSIFLAAFPVMVSMAVFTVIYWGQPSMSGGRFMAMLAAFSSFLSAAVALSGVLNSYLMISPVYDRIKPILEATLEIDEAKNDPRKMRGNIIVSHVSFQYPGVSRTVLEDVSIEIQTGEMVALVGSSGSGKSTMLRLLLGFEKPLSGQIYYDGMDLAGLDIQEVRNQIGVVIQNAQIMSDDIYKNIIGASNLSIEDAWAAARQVNLEREIEEMPMGMHTFINEGGRSLSGGQRQRILIARALVKKPAILFLDEATSALDNVTQAVVAENLERLSVTRVVIAHRLSTIQNADRILVFDQGRIVQNGTYEELNNQPGLFQELARRQIS